MTPQAAAVPFRRTADGDVEVLLVTSKTRKRWILPKGKVPRDMLACAAAAREAWEEGGVLGTVRHEPIGTYQQLAKMPDANAAQTLIEAFPLEVRSELAVWPEMDSRSRRWWPIARALEIVTDGGLRSVLEALGRELDDGPAGQLTDRQSK